MSSATYYLALFTAGESDIDEVKGYFSLLISRFVTKKLPALTQFISWLIVPFYYWRVSLIRDAIFDIFLADHSFLHYWVRHAGFWRHCARMMMRTVP